MKTIKQVVSEVYDESARLLGEYIADAVNEETGVGIKHLWCGYNKMHRATYTNAQGFTTSTPLDIKIKVQLNGNVVAYVTSLSNLFDGMVAITFNKDAIELYANVENGAAAYSFLSEKERSTMRPMNALAPGVRNGN